MFVYCTEVLHLSDAEASLRIAVARAAREHPMLLPMLADGRMHLAGIAKLAPHLAPANREPLLSRATHCSKLQIEELEYHHRRPFGLGGDHSPTNISLACRTHNTFLAERDFGRRAMAQFRRTAGRDSGRGARDERPG